MRYIFNIGVIHVVANWPKMVAGGGGGRSLCYGKSVIIFIQKGNFYENKNSLKEKWNTFCIASQRIIHPSITPFPQALISILWNCVWADPNQNTGNCFLPARIPWWCIEFRAEFPPEKALGLLLPCNLCCRASFGGVYITTFWAQKAVPVRFPFLVDRPRNASNKQKSHARANGNKLFWARANLHTWAEMSSRQQRRRGSTQLPSDHSLVAWATFNAPHPAANTM